MLYSDLFLLAPAAIIFFILLLRAARRKRVPAQEDAPHHRSAPTEDGPPANAIVVDGSNVMHWGGEPSAQVLSLVLRKIEAAGYAPIVFFDANVGYVLGDRYFDELRMAQLTGVAKDHICVVDKGVIADEAILMFARDHGLRIVTNDRYRDWKNAFPHLRKKGTLVKGNFTSGHAKLPTL